MGYDLHIVRTRSWLDAQRVPITNADVDTLITRDADYAWSTSDVLDIRDHETGEERRQWSLEWRGEFLAWWDRGELSSKSPDEVQALRLLRLADALGAMVVGDDDELYRVVMDEDGKPELAWEQWDGKTGLYEPVEAKRRAGEEAAARRKPWLRSMYVRLDRALYRIMNGVDREG